MIDSAKLKAWKEACEALGELTASGDCIVRGDGDVVAECFKVEGVYHRTDADDVAKSLCLAVTGMSEAIGEIERLQAVIDRVGEIAPQLQSCHVHGEDGSVSKLITALYAALGTP